jgi:plasmid stabilization system protein ParE
LETSKENASEQKVNYQLLLRPQSYIDLEESFQWYSNQQNNLGLNFLKQVEICFEKIKSNPYSYQLIKKKLRRAIVKKFPYGIFYQIENKEIIVFAIFHLSRDPKSIKRRI